LRVALLIFVINIQQMKKRGIRKENLILVYNYEDLSPVGVFLNTMHVKEVLGIDPGNLTKYFDGSINKCTPEKGGNYVAVKIGRDSTAPLDTNKMLEKGLPLAQERKTQSILATLTTENIKGLTSDKIKAIQEILNK